MESRVEISAKNHALSRTLQSQISCTSLRLPPFSLSSYTSLTCHLLVKTFTIELLSFAPSLRFSSCKLWHPDTGHVQLCFASCLWLKCSSGREAKSKENTTFSLSQLFMLLKFVQWRRFFFSQFFSRWFSGFCHHVSLRVFLNHDVALLTAELYKISAWVLVN